MEDKVVLSVFHYLVLHASKFTGQSCATGCCHCLHLSKSLSERKNCQPIITYQDLIQKNKLNLFRLSIIHQWFTTTGSFMQRWWENGDKFGEHFFYTSIDIFSSKECMKLCLSITYVSVVTVWRERIFLLEKVKDNTD